jgi:predicted DNA-binding transcriptional regulator YafY
LQILLLLQNRGRMTAPALARELEVTPRTILRDVDALTEAGLPVITHRGVQGGIELAFNHRTRLTGLATDEAEALAIWLSAIPPALGPLGLESAARRARAKLLESLSDQNRAVIATTGHRFALQDGPVPDDPRVQAMADALRDHRHVVLRSGTPAETRFRPERLGCDSRGWWVEGPPPTVRELREDWGNIVVVRPLG